MANLAEMYGIIEYIAVAGWFLKRLDLEARVVETRVINALDCCIPWCDMHFSVRSAQRCTLANIWAGCRSCEGFLVAAVEIPETRVSWLRD